MTKQKEGQSSSLVKKISTVIAIIIGLCTLTGIGYKYDQRLAKAEDVNKSIQKLSIRLDQKIQDDRLNNIQERIWKLEDRYGTDPSKMPAETKEAYRHLLKEKEIILRTLKSIGK